MIKKLEVSNLLFTDIDENGINTCVCCGIKDSKKVESTLIIPGEITVGGIVFKVYSISYEFSIPNKVKNLIISEGIEIIDAFCFCNNSLETVKLPDTLKLIRKSSFYNCKKLNRVEISDNTSVGDYCFWGSNWLNQLISNSPISEPVYVGKNFIGWNGSASCIKVRPGTENITIHMDTAFETLEEIHLPKSIKRISLYTLIKNKLKRLFIEDLPSYLSVQIESKEDALTNSECGPVDIYIGEKKVNSLIMNKSENTIGVRPYVFLGANIENVIVGEDIEYIYANSIDYMPLKYLKFNGKTRIYGAFSDLSSIEEIFIDYKTIFENTSTFNAIFPDNKLKITISIDEGFSALHVESLMNVFRNENAFKSIIDKNLSAYLVFYGDGKVNSLTLIDFINSLSKYLSLDKLYLDREGYKYIKTLDTVSSNYTHLYVPEESYNDYINSNWTMIGPIFEYSENQISFITDTSNQTCKISCKPDKFGKNSYKGVIKIPKHIRVDGVDYTVIMVDDFSFYECDGIEKILLPDKVELSPLALLGNNSTIIERY